MNLSGTKMYELSTLPFRLHNAQELSVASQTIRSPRNQRKRARRHLVRKLLLVLDYLIDTIAGTFIIALFFYGENKGPNSLLYQRILHCVGAFCYGILIPMAHLLNESRLRTIIVNDGWFQGFKSIFCCGNKTRSNRRRKRNLDQFNGVLS